LRDEKANSMPSLIRAVRAGSTLGEIMQVGREIYGPWQEPMVI
jgi:methylmalonyl-CoA mutase N-terminal domain/subunit